jgi:hypothetical protein
MITLAQLLFLAVVLTYAAFPVRRWLRRRAAFREFAAARGLRFRGIIPSDKYAPYALFSTVSIAVLLYHVVEGRLNGLDIAVFDLPRKQGTCTGAIVSGLPIVEASEAPRDPDVSFDVRDGHLCGIRPSVRIEEMPAFVEYVMSVATRLIDGRHDEA